MALFKQSDTIKPNQERKIKHLAPEQQAHALAFAGAQAPPSRLCSTASSPVSNPRARRWRARPAARRLL